MRRPARHLAVMLAALAVVAIVPAAPAAALSVGTLTTTTLADPTCPSGFTCQGFIVRCAGVQKDAKGWIASSAVPASPRGLVVFYNAGTGKDYWTDDHDSASAMVDDLIAQGLQVLQVRWKTPWPVAMSGERVGQGALGCRPATTIAWIRQNRYPPPGMSPNTTIGRCGFCVVGSSAGANQASYPLSHYGLDSVIDAVIVSGGPALAGLAKGCRDTPGYRYSPTYEADIDRGYGYIDRPGPCRRSNPSYEGVDWTARWTADGVDTGGTDYLHGSTRIHMLLGEQDRNVTNHARDYRDRLTAAGTSRVCLQVIPGMGHGIKGSPAGMAALENAIVGEACPA